MGRVIIPGRMVTLMAFVSSSQFLKGLQAGVPDISKVLLPRINPCKVPTWLLWAPGVLVAPLPGLSKVQLRCENVRLREEPGCSGGLRCLPMGFSQCDRRLRHGDTAQGQPEVS